jgi:enoyl-CoA hydratase/carnithine racemase
MGAGLSVGLACDVRLTSSTATLGAAFADLAASGDFGGPWLAARLIGLGRAKDLYFLNDWLDAEVEAETRTKAMRSEDFRRATASFLAKRPPTFQGR